MDVLLFKYFAGKNSDTMRDVAKIIGVSTTTMSNKLAQKRGDFSRADIAKLKKRWQLTPEQVDKIFFND